MMKITFEDLSRLKVGQTIAVGPLDFAEIKTLRQIVYNRQQTYTGCAFDTTKSYQMFPDKKFPKVLIIKRLSFGVSKYGIREPQLDI